jgi:hypothetical protein
MGDQTPTIDVDELPPVRTADVIVAANPGISPRLAEIQANLEARRREEGVDARRELNAAIARAQKRQPPASTLG